jgi:signal transduction histidine kinase
MSVNTLASGRHWLTGLAGSLAVGALVQDLARPTVTLQSGDYDRGPEPVILVVLVGVVVLVALRERLGLLAPVSAIALLGLACLSSPAWVLNSSFIFLLVMLLCGLAGYLAFSWLHHTAIVVLWVVGSLASWRNPEGGIGDWVLTVAYMSTAWAIGALIRRPVVRARSAEQRAADLEDQHGQAARRAVRDERQRIARELHDIIAHSMSVMTLQAGAVRLRLRPTQTVENDSLRAVERTGREALAEVRRLVGLWNEEGETAHYAPQPGMATFDTLLAGVRSAGVPVELCIEGTSRELAPGVDLTAYRVVQEALTNVIKHAGPARASVHIVWHEEEMQIEVADDGRNPAEGVGFGHAGMRERLRIFGGRMESGPRPEGGYLLRAWLPIGSEL